MGRSLSLLLAGVAVAWSGPSVCRGEDAAMLSLNVKGEAISLHHFAPAEQESNGTSMLLIPGWPAVSEDVLGLGSALSSRGVHVFVIHPRGHGPSGGQATFANALEDVAAAWGWLASKGTAETLGLDPNRRVLAGYSWGGGIALAFAAQQPSVGRVVSIAGSDHGAFIRRVDRDPEYGALYRRALESTQAPDGPVRFDVDADFEELRNTQMVHDLVTIAPRLAKRDILIIAGWDDEQVELEHQVLPFYRALRASGSEGVRVLTFQDGHGFTQVRESIVDGVTDWLLTKNTAPGGDMNTDRIAAAEQFFRGVYGGDPSVVDSLASDDIVITYPIFASLFSTPVIRGRAAVREFASGFSERWADPHISVHEAVGNDLTVVLVWSFRGRNVGSSRPERPSTNQEHSWGGITLYRFDHAGKIVAEVGEESEPGPMERLSTDASSK
jgi:pimeloyl-ACP methyl ester carboxylesterase